MRVAARSPLPRFDDTRVEHRIVDGRPAVVYEAIRYRSPKRASGSSPSRRSASSLLERAAACVALIALATVYFRVVRPWQMTWGATEAEARGKVAGDELIPNAGIVSTRVVEIGAPASAIWPWLVQMGPGRGGAYTYDWIERRLGIDIRNVDQIVPEFQNLDVGDEIGMPGYTMRVERLDAERAMVVRSSNRAWLWAFELRPADGRTRLISRNSFDTSALRMRDWLVYPIIEPGSWVMERKMLLTIKRLAESLASSRAARPREPDGSS